MSIKIMSQIWDNAKDLSGTRLLVILCIADHANDDGMCWPSVNRIADRCRITTVSAMRYTKELESMGYLAIDRTPGKVNHYRITMPTSADAVTSNKTVTRNNIVTGTPNNVVTSTRNNAVTTPVTMLLPEPSLEPSLEPSFRTTTTMGGVVRSYESNIGQLTSHISEMIADAVDEHGAQLVEDAIKEATRQNVRKWAYVDGILKRWSANGRQPAKRTRKAEQRRVEYTDPMTGETIIEEVMT